MSAQPPACASMQPRRAAATDRSALALVVDLDVPDVARGTICAPVDVTLHDDPGADPRPDLQVHEIRHSGVDESMLPERHGVDVVLHEDGRPVPRGEVARDVKVVPAGHDRCVTDPSRPVVHRPGDVDADRAHVCCSEVLAR